jgi:ATP-dependent Lon protease
VTEEKIKKPVNITVQDPTGKRRSRVPVLCPEGTLIFPYTLSPLMIVGEENIKMVTRISNSTRLLAVFPELPPDEVIERSPLELSFDECKFGEKRIAKVGCLARIVKILKFPDGSVRVLLRGLKRVSMIKAAPVAEEPLLLVVEDLVDEPDVSIETAAMVKNAITQFQEVISFAPSFPEELKVAIMNVDDNVRLVDLVADALNIDFVEKLMILSLDELRERLQLLSILLNREVEVLQLGSDIQSQVHNAMGKQQRDFFLREQLKTIKAELGEENRNPDLIAIEERMADLDLPKNVLEVIEKEKSRLEIIPQASPEYHVAFNFINWLLSVPWNVYSDEVLDVKESMKVLEHDHYGLKDIKERIIEFIAVLQLKKNKDRKAPILCFVGPPGVGKTSLGQSIARSMQRKFVRMSLGGVRDEAEIRGHRRTYIGAMPGRIIQGLKKVGVANPVFMLDEIDKVSHDYRGDPASALLEVLDPQQNVAFNDHYLELDYDLSSVMFIATANVLDSIPPALLDRMEIIRLPGYTMFEKKQIAKRYLIPRQLKENGIKQRQLSLSMAAVEEIIDCYTREAGVRTLERTIGTVCRKVARKLVEGTIADKTRTVLKAEDIHEILGARKFLPEVTDEKLEPGVATGMAWTSVGGTILSIEATMMPGKGVLKLTGSLGDVMKESAEAAFSYIRANAIKWKIGKEVFTDNDFHIHVPDGATPKDGPSAGITITTALVSLLTGKPSVSALSMTGEITLRGKVTAVGGIKEKVIAALRAGVKTIVLPEANRKDLEEIPENLCDKLEFRFVDNISKALKITLEK